MAYKRWQLEEEIPQGSGTDRFTLSSDFTPLQLNPPLRLPLPKALFSLIMSGVIYFLGEARPDDLHHVVTFLVCGRGNTGRTCLMCRVYSHCATVSVLNQPLCLQNQAYDIAVSLTLISPTSTTRPTMVPRAA